MRTRVTSLAVVCLLFISLPAVGQPDIFSAVPGDAYGFVATKSLQGSYDKIMAFARAMGVPVPPDNKLLAIQEHVGEIDLNGPAAIILLDPQKYSGEPIALLLSAADDAQTILESHKAETEPSDDELPAGVVRGADGYLGVKNGFVVFAPKAEQAAAVLASQRSLETMPAVRAAFDKGQIVLAGDLKRAAPMIMQFLQMAQAQMASQMDTAPVPNAAMAKDMFSLYLDLAQALIVQTDKLTVAVDVNADRAVVTKHVLFEADSPAAGFMNAQMSQAVPSYNALPGGPFLMAGGFNVVPEGYQALASNIMMKLISLPSFEGKLSEAQVQQMVTDSAAASGMLSGGAFTLNIGNPMTGMFNIIFRGDVSDVPAYKKLVQKIYESEANSIYFQASGMPADYIYNSAAETVSGVDVDTIKIQMSEEAAADPMMAQQMQMMAMMYGPDMTFRMAAPSKKQLLFTMGGGAELMERAINVAQGHGSMLANGEAIKQAGTNLPAKRFAEFHLDLNQLVPMMMMFAMGQPGAAPTGATAAPPVSFSCSAEANTLRADMVLHSATVKSLIEAMGPMMRQQMGPGAEPPDEEF